MRSPARLTFVVGATLAVSLGLGGASHVLARGVETHYRIGGALVEDRMYDFGVLDSSRLDVKSITTLDPGAALAPLLGTVAAKVPPLVVVGDTRTPARFAAVLRLAHALVAFAVFAALARRAGAPLQPTGSDPRALIRPSGLPHTERAD